MEFISSLQSFVQTFTSQWKSRKWIRGDFWYWRNQMGIFKKSQLGWQFSFIDTKNKKIVAIFFHSPVKNDSLHKHAKSKTRWNSLLQMLKWFLLFKNGVQKASHDHSQVSEFLINDVEMMIDLVHVLETMEISSVNISVDDSSLLDAIQIMEFAFVKFQENQSIIAKRMHEQLVKRFDKRKAPPALRNSSSVVAKQWFIFGLSKA